MSTHTIQTEIEVVYPIRHGDGEVDEVAYPTIEISYDYSRGSPTFTPRGEYGPIDPPEPPSLEFREAKYIDRDGLNDDPVKLQERAKEWLEGSGYDYACDCAETDLLATRAAHMEHHREQ